jgi:hypothetical protein
VRTCTPRPVLCAVLGFVTVLSACASDDGTGPANGTLIQRFDSLRADAEAQRQFGRAETLHRATQILRFGAPVNTVTLGDGAQARSYSAVAMREDFDDPFLGIINYITLVAWRGENAETLLQVTGRPGTIYFQTETPSTSPPDDENAFIGNSNAPIHAFIVEGAAVWGGYQGSATLSVRAEGGRCHPAPGVRTDLFPGARCQAAVFGTTFALDFRRPAPAGQPPSDQRALSADRQTITGVLFSNH